MSFNQVRMICEVVHMTSAPKARTSNPHRHSYLPDSYSGALNGIP